MRYCPVFVLQKNRLTFLCNEKTGMCSIVTLTDQASQSDFLILRILAAFRSVVLRPSEDPASEQTEKC